MVLLARAPFPLDDLAVPYDPVVALGVLFAMATVAAPPHSEIEWSAPESCPGRRDLVQQIERYLGGPLEPSTYPGFAASGVITATDDGFSLALRVELEGGRTEQNQAASTCGELLRFTALKIAFTLDPMGVLERIDTEPASADPVPEAEPGQNPPPVVSPAPDVEEPDPQPASAPRLRGSVRATGGLRFGLLPGVAPGFSGAFALLGTAWRLELEGGYWLPRAERYETEPSVGADFQAGSLTLRGCPVPAMGPVEFPICAGLEGGLVRGEGVGADQAVIRNRPWLAAVVGPALAWVVHPRVALWLRPELVAVLSRPKFGITGLGELHEVAPVGARAELGAEVRFW